MYPEQVRDTKTFLHLMLPQPSVTVLDDNLGRVTIYVWLPDGTRTQSGKCGNKFEIEYMGGNDVDIPSDGSWVEFVVADSAAELVMAASSEIADVINDAMPEVNLAAKFGRLGFHDYVGGYDGW